ncbi:hypothetical protein M0802_004618 [Mischocyttarus mexicanus]|nr:hypothetical protein M0802_004618 [Mischocyttarus mexicanus]
MVVHRPPTFSTISTKYGQYDDGTTANAPSEVQKLEDDDELSDKPRIEFLREPGHSSSSRPMGMSVSQD